MNIKALRVFSWITLLAFLPVSGVFAAPAGQITQASGYVAVSSAIQKPKSAGSGEGIENGQTVTLDDDSRAVIRFLDGQVIALQSKTIFKVNIYKYHQPAPANGQTFLSLLLRELGPVTYLSRTVHKAG